MYDHATEEIIRREVSTINAIAHEQKLLKQELKLVEKRYSLRGGHERINILNKRANALSHRAFVLGSKIGQLMKEREMNYK